MKNASIISLSKCKVNKESCSILRSKDKNHQCYKLRKEILEGTESWEHCRGIRTPLNKTRVDILKKIESGATLYWCAGAFLKYMTECKSCGGIKEIEKIISMNDFWLLKRGEYIEEGRSGEGSIEYNITKKGIVYAFINGE